MFSRGKLLLIPKLTRKKERPFFTGYFFEFSNNVDYSRIKCCDLTFTLFLLKYIGPMFLYFYMILFIQMIEFPTIDLLIFSAIFLQYGKKFIHSRMCFCNVYLPIARGMRLRIFLTTKL